MAEEKRVNVICAPHCANYPCLFEATVVDGKVTRLDKHPRLSYMPCPKGRANIELLYHPDRLLYPLRRVGERGEGKWQRISWDEALEAVASQLSALKARYGNNAIMLYHYVGRHGLPGGVVGATSTILRLFNLWGGAIYAYQRSGLCMRAIIDASRYLYGSYKVALPPDIDCKLIIIWSTNPAETAYRGAIQSFEQARKGGTRFVVLDPALTPTATALRAEHIPIRPGSDMAVGLAMMNTVLSQGLYDKEMILKHTNAPFLVRMDSGELLRERDVAQGGSDKSMVWDHLAQKPRPCDAPGISPALEGSYSANGIRFQPVWQVITDRVQEWSPQRAASISGLPAETVERLSRELATSRPAKIYFGVAPGFNRASWAENTMWVLASLNVITGNFRGVYPIGDPRYPSGVDGGIELTTREWEIDNPVSRRIPVNHLAEAILQPSRYDVNIKGLFVTRGNPVNQHANSNKTVEALKRLEFVAVCDMFMTATARYADIVLPVSTPLETMSLVEGSEVSRFIYHTLLDRAPKIQLFLGQPAVSPLGESKDDFEIVLLLARKLGLGQYFPWKSAEEWIEELLERGKRNPDFPWLKPVTLEQLRREGIVDLATPLPVPSWDLGTPSGRVELYSESLLKRGYDPFPEYRVPEEGPEASPELYARYPLRAVSYHSIWRAHSSYANQPTLLERHPPQVWINPEDASSREINDGDLVALFNDRGRTELKARVTSRIMKGVVRLAEGGWPEHGMFNLLTSDRLTTYGENPTYNTTLVEVQKVQAMSEPCSAESPAPGNK